jgi:hypothetical protein
MTIVKKANALVLSSLMLSCTATIFSPVVTAKSCNAASAQGRGGLNCGPAPIVSNNQAAGQVTGTKPGHTGSPTIGTSNQNPGTKPPTTTKVPPSTDTPFDPRPDPIRVPDGVKPPDTVNVMAPNVPAGQIVPVAPPQIQQAVAPQPPVTIAPRRDIPTDPRPDPIRVPDGVKPPDTVNVISPTVPPGQIIPVLPPQIQQAVAPQVPIVIVPHPVVMVVPPLPIQLTPMLIPPQGPPQLIPMAIPPKDPIVAPPLLPPPGDIPTDPRPDPIRVPDGVPPPSTVNVTGPSVPPGQITLVTPPPIQQATAPQQPIGIVPPKPPMDVPPIPPQNTPILIPPKGPPQQIPMAIPPKDPPQAPFPVPVPVAMKVPPNVGGGVPPVPPAKPVSGLVVTSVSAPAQPNGYVTPRPKPNSQTSGKVVAPAASDTASAAPVLVVTSEAQTASRNEKMITVEPGRQPANNYPTFSVDSATPNRVCVVSGLERRKTVDSNGTTTYQGTLPTFRMVAAEVADLPAWHPLDSGCVISVTHKR